MLESQHIMEEVEELNQHIREACSDISIEKSSKEDMLDIENESEVDWEDIFSKYVDSIQDLAVNDINQI